jgi:hypothetical protein
MVRFAVITEEWHKACDALRAFGYACLGYPQMAE